MTWKSLPTHGNPGYDYALQCLRAFDELLALCKAHVAVGDYELTSTTSIEKVRELNAKMREESDIRLQMQ